MHRSLPRSQSRIHPSFLAFWPAADLTLRACRTTGVRSRRPAAPRTRATRTLSAPSEAPSQPRACAYSLFSLNLVTCFRTLLLSHSCIAGYTGDSLSGCTACAAGEEKPSVGPALCTSCKPGNYSTGSAPRCSACPAGKFGSGNGLSSSLCSGPCNTDHYCPTGSVSANQFTCVLFCPCNLCLPLVHSLCHV